MGYDLGIALFVLSGYGRKAKGWYSYSTDWYLPVKILYNHLLRHDAMPPFDGPLPLTPLVQRALSFAEDYYDVLGVSLVRLAVLIRTPNLLPVPDIMDRYNIAGCFVYVRADLVVLVREQTMLYTDATCQRITIRARLAPDVITPKTAPILVNVPYRDEGD